MGELLLIRAKYGSHAGVDVLLREGINVGYSSMESTLLQSPGRTHVRTIASAILFQVYSHFLPRVVNVEARNTCLLGRRVVK